MEESVQSQDFVQEEAGSSDAEAVAVAQPKMEQLRADNPDLSKFSLIAKARDLLDAELRNLLANAEADRKELEGLRARIRPLEEKVSHAEAAEKAAILAYFSEETEQYHEYLTDETKERLRSSGVVAVASPAKRKATKKPSSAIPMKSGKGAEKVYTPATLRKLLGKVKKDRDGYAGGRDVWDAVNTKSIDQAAVRLELKTGEIQSKPKKGDGSWSKMTVNPDGYKLERGGDKSHRLYRINLDLVLSRLNKS